jgi:hypothetical protein
MAGDSPKSFTAFRSAAEEVAHAAVQRALRSPDIVPHGRAASGRIVQTGDKAMPYRAVLSYPGGVTAEYSFVTMRAAESFISASTPEPEQPDCSRDYPTALPHVMSSPGNKAGD